MLTFNELKKNLKKDFSGLKKVKIAILSDSASQFLTQALKGYGFTANINFEVYEADYNQIDLQIFDPFSELYEFEADFIIINRCTEKLYKDFCKNEKAGQASYADYVTQLTEKYYDTITSKRKAKIIVNTFPEINDSVFGNYAAKVPSSFLFQLRKANLQLMECSQRNKDMFVCDLASLQSRLGHKFVFDPKMYINADMVYSIDFVPYIAKHLTDIIQSITGTFKKCLILDLDNTTWGGIIGDDGLEGIQVGYLGMGKVFTELQMWAKQLKQRGIIIAICSKNTDEIAREPFISHPDMVLKIDDIAVFVANWETKVDNIKYIQQVLNIGFDSMVFLDDNPFEREMVKSAIADITVPDLPEDPAEYLDFIRAQNLFETASYTEEDSVRTKQYQEETKRQELMLSFENELDFLQSLNMLSEVKPFDEFSIPRVSQLTQRSNQFNLRTIRYTEEDLKTMIGNPDYFTLSLTLEDKFGDHGLIGIIILKRADDDTLFIDSWIMSCRVLKRGMENFTLNTIAKLASLHNFKKVVGEYIPTKKNGLVSEHYAKLGFAHTDDKWTMELADYKQHESYIKNK